MIPESKPPVAIEIHSPSSDKALTKVDQNITSPLPDFQDETIAEDVYYENPNFSPIFNTSKMSNIQRTIYDFFEKPQSTLAKSYHYMSYLLIIYSTIEVNVETFPWYTGENGTSTVPSNPGIFAMECVVFVWWMVELLGRFCASTNRILFLVDFYTIVDILAILPFFFVVSNNDDSSQNLTRLFRLLRILKATKLSQYSVGIKIGLRAIKRSSDAIWMLLLFLLLSLLISSSAMFWAERGTWDKERHYWVRSDGSRSPFNSIPEGFYWGMATLATVGYGDVVPITGTGKFIASMTMVLSIMTIALPTSIIGSNFMAEWQIYQRISFQKKMKKSRDITTSTSSLATKDLSNAKLVLEQNRIMLQSIAEIQDKLSDINPPQYYQKCKEYQLQNQKLKSKIQELEKDIHHWKSKHSGLKDKYEKLLSMRKETDTDDAEKPEKPENYIHSSRKSIFGSHLINDGGQSLSKVSSFAILNKAKKALTKGLLAKAGPTTEDKIKDSVNIKSVDEHRRRQSFDVFPSKSYESGINFNKK